MHVICIKACGMGTACGVIRMAQPSRCRSRLTISFIQPAPRAKDHRGTASINDMLAWPGGPYVVASNRGIMVLRPTITQRPTTGKSQWRYHPLNNGQVAVSPTCCLSSHERCSQVPKYCRKSVSRRRRTSRFRRRRSGRIRQYYYVCGYTYHYYGGLYRSSLPLVNGKVSAKVAAHSKHSTPEARPIRTKPMDSWSTYASKPQRHCGYPIPPTASWFDGTRPAANRAYSRATEWVCPPESARIPAAGMMAAIWPAEWLWMVVVTRMSQPLALVSKALSLRSQIISLIASTVMAMVKSIRQLESWHSIMVLTNVFCGRCRSATRTLSAFTGYR